MIGDMRKGKAVSDPSELHRGEREPDGARLGPVKGETDADSYPRVVGFATVTWQSGAERRQYQVPIYALSPKPPGRGGESAPPHHDRRAGSHISLEREK